MQATWIGFHGRKGFASSSRTGKWILRMDAAEASGAMERLRAAIDAGLLPAAKRSGPGLEDEIGAALVLAYSERNDPDGAARTLRALRGIGLLGPASFKDDMATYHGVDEMAYRDVDLEAGDGLSPGGVLPEGAVLRRDDGAYVEAWMTGKDPHGALRGVGWRLQAQGKDGVIDEARWLDPEVRMARRLFLVRIDMGGIAHVIEPGAVSGLPRMG